VRHGRTLPDHPGVLGARSTSPKKEGRIADASLDRVGARGIPVPGDGAEQAQAATVDISIVSASAGFDSKVAAGAFADTFCWTNNDTITHTTTQNAPLSLWNSHLSGGSSFSKTINFAGSYPYHCAIHSSMTGTIQGAAPGHPPSGSPGTTFAVASVVAPSGSVYDIQRKKGSGDCTAWKTGITSKSVTFKPKASGT
jgi:plastocyanin